MLPVELFDYELPGELIAQEPIEKRDSSKLLILNRKTGKITHHKFSEIVEYLEPSDLLVINESKVFPARIFGYRQTGGKAEAVFLRQNSEGKWRALIGTRGKPQQGEIFSFADNKLKIKLIEKDERGVWTVEPQNCDVMTFLEQYGVTPLPPYIRRKHPQNLQTAYDRERYQTVYGSVTGSAAAPTAGLHFTEEIFKKIRENGVEIARVSLHIGYETFRPVKTKFVETHKMHSEYFEVKEGELEKIKSYVASGKRIVAVGTTSCRVLETLASESFSRRSGETDMFIYPGFEFRATDSLITNFHLPRSSLLMLVSAFAGREKILSAYEAAARERYRFYSFGDAMFIV